MAPRKDMMRIIRQDSGFAAKLEVGEANVQSSAAEAHDHREAVGGIATPAFGAHQTTVGVVVPSSARQDGGGIDRKSGAQTYTPPQEIIGPTPRPHPVTVESGPVNAQSIRGRVVYVSVSLTARQATLAADWAVAAKCSVPFFIRHVAQSLRDQICEDWERDGMPEITELRGARGKVPTSVTLTLPSGFAEALVAQHDPARIRGLARVIGPAFRAQFETAFDAALNGSALGTGEEPRVATHEMVAP